MVKHIATLVYQAVRVQQVISAAILRIQHGFLPEQNIRELRIQLKEFQTIVEAMELTEARTQTRQTLK